MPTSELSDALNPYYAQPRSRNALGQHRSPPVLQPTAPQQQLELAVAEPPSGHGPARSTNQHNGGIHAVQELLRFLASTREAQEIENKRRIAWEQEQEAKYKLRQAEMERRMIEMQQEIAALKARVAFGGSSLAGASQHAEYAPFVSSSQQPTPSTSPTLSHPSTPVPCSPAAGQPVRALDSTETSSSMSYLASSMVRFVNANARSNLRHVKGHSAAESDSEEDVNVDDDSPPAPDRAVKHAMRNHILRMMMLETDKDLPDSHVEGTPLGPDDPVRFVWDKTPRQSVHNGRMKERVLQDLRANRKLYRHVTDKDFGRKTLDSVFDQAFVTFRQKFKAQGDDPAGRAQKQRDELKAQRARRLSRRKVKLYNRSDARNKMAAFEDVGFDGALQMECMSSEESTEEEDAATGTRVTMFRIRGCSWRSVRLQRFFDVLDEEDKVDNAQRPRRGVGRRERIPGPTKEGALPPKGVARWMVSKRWHGEVAVFVPDPGRLDGLGEESALEDIPTV